MYYTKESQLTELKIEIQICGANVAPIPIWQFSFFQIQKFLKSLAS